ncbi:MAG: indole-3-glycerol phosphate synthase/phosphoribosylanthranilate isomerase, partial [Candidatus Krumholzibacteriia bacterium]
FVQHAPPSTLARSYYRNGAAAISIVTDREHFGTSLADVANVKAAMPLPVLVKDFVIDEVQITAAWAAGADAVLLIVRMLDGQRLAELLRFARSLGLHVLVECHDQADIDLAIGAEARIIGVNNRNLATLTTDLAHGAAMMPGVPDFAIRVSESGLYDRADVERMANVGADACLIGHALLVSGDPGRKVAELSGIESEGKVRTKTCGITSSADAQMAHAAGSNILGMIFAKSARQIDIDRVQEIRRAVPRSRLCGVFVDAEPSEVIATATACDLDLIQLHGDESPAYCEHIASALGLPLVKAFTAENATEENASAYSAVAYFLVDLPKGKSGIDISGAACRAAAKNLVEAGYDVFLAGGLTAESVNAAISEVNPFAVDVASGIEDSPGHKDPIKTRTFIAEAIR